MIDSMAALPFFRFFPIGQKDKQESIQSFDSDSMALLPFRFFRSTEG
jgi:hypothetical protein